MNDQKRDHQFLASLAQQLKAARKARQLSQNMVTMDTGINVSRAESGKRILSVYSIAILCKYYNIEMKDFFQGIGLTTKPWE